MVRKFSKPKIRSDRIRDKLIGNSNAKNHKYKCSEETGRKISLALKNKPKSKEHKRKLSISAMGNKNGIGHEVYSMLRTKDWFGYVIGGLVLIIFIVGMIISLFH